MLGSVVAKNVVEAMLLAKKKYPNKALRVVGKSHTIDWMNDGN